MLKEEQFIRLRRVRKIASLMDTKFGIFGIRFGADSLLGLFPGAGDLLAGVISFYIIYQARAMNVPSDLVGRMILNTAIDVIVGGVPVAGDIFDIFFKSNIRNLAIIEEYFNDDNLAL